METTVLKDRYAILSTLGEGAFATTYLALDRETERKCVVKSLSLRRVDALKTHELFEREARVLESLDHARIPKLVDFFTADSGDDVGIFLVQEYVEGRNLAEHVGSGRRFKEEEVLELAAVIAEILVYLQGFSPPLIHRDIKPSNVLLTAESKAFLVDFGAVRDKVLHEPMLQRGGPTIVGTYGYMPLEQFEGQAVPASDIYSLGATLVYLLSHKEPWQMEKEGIRLDFRPHVNVSSGFARVLERMLDPDWKKRYPSARELRRDLERLRRPKRPRSRLVVSAALLLLGLATGAGILARKEPYPATLLSVVGLDLSSADALGDTLPSGAVERLGTMRLRHGGPVRSIAFAPDGKALASGSDDETLSLWDVSTGRELHRWVAWRRIDHVAFSPNGKELAFATAHGGPTYVADLATGALKARFQGAPWNGSSGESGQVAFSPDGSRLAWIEPSLAIRLSRLESLEPPRRIGSTPGPPRSLLFAPDGKALVAATANGQVTFFDLAGVVRSSGQGQPLAPGHAAALSSDGALLATSSYNEIRLSEVATSKEVAKLPGGARALAFSRGGKLLAAASSDGLIRIADATKGTWLLDWQGHRATVTSLAFSPDERLLASSAEDGTIGLWNAVDGRAALALQGHEGSVDALAFAPDGALASGGADRTSRIWTSIPSAAGLRAPHEIHRRVLAGPVRHLAFLSGERMLVASADRFHVWDRKTNWEILESPLPASRAVVTTPDGERIAAASREWGGIFRTATGDRLSPIPQGESPLAFSPDGRLLVTAQGSKLALRDGSSGEMISRFGLRSTWDFGTACFFPDGRYLLAGTTLYRVEPANPQQPLVYLSMLGSSGLCAVSPDGTLVASTGKPPSTIDLYQVKRASGGGLSPERRATFPGHRGPVTSLAFSPDGRRLASGSADTSILVWDVNRTAPQGTRQGGDAPRLQLRFEGNLEGIGIIPTRLAEEDTAVRFVPGRVGMAARFDGQLEIPEAGSIVMGDSFTFELWFQLDDGATWQAGKDQQVFASELLTFDVRDQGRNPIAFVSFARQGGHASVSLREQMGPVVPGRWYHLAVAHDGASKNLTVYVDGAEILSQPATYGLPVSPSPGLLRLGQSAYSGAVRFQGLLDEIALYDYVRSKEQIARDGLRAEREASLPDKPLPVRIEEPILPETVSAHVRKKDLAAFTVYELTGDLTDTQLLDLDESDGRVWIGTAKGLLSFDVASAEWKLYGVSSGIPGERVSQVAATNRGIAVDLDVHTTPGSVRGVGLYLFDPGGRGGRIWRPLSTGFIWDLFWDGEALWLGRGSGAERLDLDGRAEALAEDTSERYTRASNGLIDDDVHAVRAWRDTVWFATLGDYVEKRKDFAGGGVSRLDRTTGKWTSFTTKDGLARDYSCDLVVDDDEVWVAHWEEKRGLSLYDPKRKTWSPVLKSKNGLDVGGVLLANDGDTLWIGQQGGLVKLDKKTREAVRYTEIDGLPGHIVSGIAVRRDAVWVAAYTYGYRSISRSGVIRIPRN